MAVRREKPVQEREEAEEDMARYSQRRPGRDWCDVSAGMEPAGSPVTDTDGEYSSPDAPRGSGGISLSKRRRCRGR